MFKGKKDLNIGEKENEIQPFIYLNMPIDKIDDKDIIGIETQINSVKQAINKEANIIGITSDYGTGKSSLTSIISNDKKIFTEQPIIINLWDSTYKINNMIKDEKTNNESEKLEVTPLTKSFLFQLSVRRKSNNLQKYVNKRLSRNYGVLSANLSNSKGISCLITAAIFIILWLIFNSISIEYLNTIETEWWHVTFKILSLISPLFLISSIGLIILGIKRSDIIFSLWDSQGKIEPQFNDVIDVFNVIIEDILNICKKEGKKQLVIIEDLDRTNDGNLIYSFLSEIYKFNSILSKENRNKIIFLICIKPEDLLVYEKDKDKEKYELYKKIFDYTISLKTIHNEDYKTILKNIIEKDKQRIMIETNISNEDILINELSWIIKGENLSIRDIKTRLNNAFTSYLTIKYSKNEDNVAVSMLKCSAISYLENTYPECFHKFIEKENEILEFIDSVYKKRHLKQSTTSDFKEEIKKEFEDRFKFAEKKLNNNEMFAEEISNITYNDIISNDIRQYLYKYPKGSIINTAQEQVLGDLLLSKRKNSNEKELGEIINIVLDKNDRVIIQSFDKLKDLQLEFPKIIFQNKELFNIANKNYNDKTLELMENELKWQSKNIEESEFIMSKINGYMSDSDMTKLYNLYSIKLLEQLKSMSDADILNTRISLYRALGENIILYKSLYLDNKMPIISQNEIEKINDIDIVLKVIDISKLQTDEEYTYISNFINRNKLTKDQCIRGNELHNKALELINDSQISDEIFAKESFEFINTNGIYNSEYFNIISEYIESKISIEEIVNYLNKISSEVLTDSTLKLIDSFKIKKGLNYEILEQLVNKGFYTTYILCMASDQKLDHIDYTNEQVLNGIVDSCKEILGYADDYIYYIRKYILIHENEKLWKFKSLFFGDYPIISKEELYNINSKDQSIGYINFKKLDTDNIIYIIEYFNSNKLDDISTMKLFGTINSVINDQISNEFVNKFFYDLSYDIVNWSTFKNEDLEIIVNNLIVFMDLNKPQMAMKFMKHIKRNIVSLEEIVYNVGIQSQIVKVEDYIDLVNMVNNPTEKTLDIIDSFDKIYPLNNNIQDYLYKINKMDKYVVSKIMWNKNFVYDKKLINIDGYINIFNKYSEIKDYMGNNRKFINDLIIQDKLDFISEERLMYFSNVPQTIYLIKKILARSNDAFIEKYLSNIKSIKNADNSKLIREFITQDNNIKYIKQENVYQALIKCMEINDKCQLKRKRNKMKRNLLTNTEEKINV